MAVDTRHAEFAWIFKPCEEIGGDIFNFFELDEQYIGFYLLDVVGHGVPAALLSVTLSRLLLPVAGTSSVLFSSDASGRRPKRPSELANELNKLFQISESNEQYFTLLFGTMNRDTKELRYVSAGHPGPVYVPVDGCPQFLDVPGFPIGVQEEPDYEDERIVLKHGDRILVYSDGLLDAQNYQGQFFGKQGLLECVAEQQGSLQKSVRKLEERLMSWCEGHEPDDDISLLALSVSDSNSLEVTAD